jgi:hypothetical protein
LNGVFHHFRRVQTFVSFLSFPALQSFLSCVSKFLSKMPSTIVDTYTGQTLTWGMSLEDYAPIKALGERQVFHGPEPPPHGQTSQGWPEQHLFFYTEKGIDSLDRKMSKEEFQAEQAELRKWHTAKKYTYDNQLTMDIAWDRKREPHRRRFLYLMDILSSWGCYECQELHRQEHGVMKKRCTCAVCDGCESKYCGGCSSSYDPYNDNDECEY